MAVTYNQIATSTVTGSPATITISSIPATYTDLRLILYTAAAGTAGEMSIYFNGVNTGTWYGWQEMRYAGGTSWNVSKSINQPQFSTSINLNGTNPYALFMMDIFNYTDAANSAPQVQWSLGQTQYPSPGSSRTNIVSGSFSNSSYSSVTSITVGKTLGGFTSPTTISLYGILKA